jgi:molybdopterin converting factor small subunit
VLVWARFEGERLKIRLKLYGVFKSAAGSSNIQLELPSDSPTVRTVIDVLSSNPEYRGLIQLLLSDQTADPRANALIMVSGREISSRDGLETPLLESDELSLLPVAHGG